MTKNPFKRPGSYAEATSLDTEETSGNFPSQNGYRRFLSSGRTKDVAMADRIYELWDNATNSHRLVQYRQCKTSAWFVVNRQTRQVRVTSNACGLRWCPLCIRSRTTLITNEVAAWLRTAKKPKFLTFTLKHTTAPLASQIDALYKFFRALRKNPKFADKVRGGVWFFQIKRSSKSGDWHPHIHTLIDGDYMPQKMLSKLWERITHGSFVVDIQQVRDAKKAADYVARYAAAPCRLSDYDTADALEIVTTLHGRRVCGTYGSGKLIQLRPKSLDDASEWVQIDSFFSVYSSVAFTAAAARLWECWTANIPYDGPLPEPPPKIEDQFRLRMAQPVTFQQHFFEFTRT